jgi:hypothetical protein
MSGGSYNYAYQTIEQLANELRVTNPLRAAFKEHLKKVADAAQNIEWVDSGDYGPGDEDDSIKACLGNQVGPLALEAALEQAKTARLFLDDVIKLAKEQL